MKWDSARIGFYKGVTNILKEPIADNRLKGGGEVLFQKDLIDGLSFVLYMKLLINMPDMLFYGIYSVVQFCCNLFV